MMNRTRFGLPRTLSTLLSVFALSVPGAAVCGEDIERTLEMPADGLVAVENVAGTVEIMTWERAEVQIRGEAGNSVEEVEIAATASGVQVRVINRKGEHRVDGTDLQLRVPDVDNIHPQLR